MSSIDFSTSEIVAYLQTAHYARLVKQLHDAQRRRANEAAAQQARKERQKEQRLAHQAHKRDSAKAARVAAAAERESAAAAAARVEWERRVLDGLREQLADAVGEASGALPRDQRVDGVELERLCVRLSGDAISELLLLKPKAMLTRVHELIREHAAAARLEREAAEQLKDAESARRQWSDDELSALSKAMARFPGGTPSRWDCIHDKFLPSRSTKEIIAKSREIDSLNSAELLKARELVRSDFEQLQARNAATATTAAIAAAASATAAATSWSADEQARLEEALKLFPGAVADKARWEQIASHVGRSKRECVDRVRECAAATSQDAMANRSNTTAE